MRFLALLICFWIAESFPPSGARADEGKGTLVLYLERQESGFERVDLSVRSLALISGSERTDLSFHPTTFSSDPDSNPVARLTEIRLPAGSYEGLSIGVESTAASWATAPPASAPPDTLVLSEEIRILPGRITFAVVSWSPRQAARELGPTPHLELIQPELPPPGATILVSNEESGSVTLVDRFSLVPKGEIAVGKGPRGMAYSRAEQRLYVALTSDDAVAAIDLVSHRREELVSLHAGDGPSRLWLDEESGRLFVLNSASSTVSVLDARFLQETDRFTVEPEPVAFAYDSRRDQLYLSSRVTDAVAVYEIGEQRKERDWNVDGGATELLLDSANDRLFVASREQPRVLVLDASTGAVIARIELCSAAAGLGLDSTGSELIASAPDCREISFALIDQAMETTRIGLSSSPRLLALDPSSAQILAVTARRGGLAVISSSSRSMTSWIPTGRGPYAVLAP